MRILAALALTLSGVAAAPASTQGPGRPSLVWPVACEVGTSCEIQHYVDLDPSPAAKDYTCGTRTYEAHNGVDIRLPDMAAQKRGVAVLAAADGRVLRVRDGVADVSVRTTGLGAVKDTECGNGMVVAHAGGFETQYCHLAKGSVAVKPGDTVKAGTPLGRIGLSGQTEFPHLHFTVREAGKVVDPFASGAGPGTCGAGRSLWRKTPAYQARVILNLGFATAPPSMESVEAGGLASPNAAAPIVVAYGRAAGLKAGDVQELEVRGPDGAIFIQSSADPLPRNQAQNLSFAGRRRPAQGWTKGRYQGAYRVKSGGQVVLSRAFALTL